MTSLEQWLTNWLGEQGSRTVGQLTIERCNEGYRVDGPGGNESAEPVDMDDGAFATWVRRDDAGRYRPLTGARTLRSGWSRSCANLGQVIRTVDAVYPLALEHLRQQAHGQLRIVPADDVLARQTGRYRTAAETSTKQREKARLVLCADCVRSPAWAGEQAEGIPCPEPCSFFVGLCQEVAGWGGSLPDAHPVDPDIGYAEFGHPGNRIRETMIEACSEMDSDS